MNNRQRSFLIGLLAAASLILVLGRWGDALPSTQAGAILRTAVLLSLTWLFLESIS